MGLRAPHLQGQTQGNCLGQFISPRGVCTGRSTRHGAQQRYQTFATQRPGLDAGDRTRGGRVEAIAPPSPQVVSEPTGSESTEANLAPPQEVSAEAISGWIEKNYRRHTGDSSFLEGPTERTLRLNEQVTELRKEESKRGVLDVDPSVPSTITAFPPGYIDKDLETVVGLMTDKPLKRSIKPLGGTRVVRKALEAYGYTPDLDVERLYTEVRKTQSDGIFDVYTPEMRVARKNGILTGLPDGYARGRVIGDYRRVALYGADRLIDAKGEDLKALGGAMTEETIRLREEIQEQIRSLKELKQMALSYGYDISQPASNGREAVQWTYFAYLAAIKEQDGAAMSFGRIDAFLDVYFQRDLEQGVFTEEEIQEFVDHFVMKLRLVKHLRTPEYNMLFAGDPTWVTTVLGGVDSQGQSMVTKTSFRVLRTLTNLGPAPEPNITVLWNEKLPQFFKDYCSHVSIETSSIQYESDVLMQPMFGSDYGIACCVSAMRLGKDMQYFGARCNLPKLLLYTLNGGRDEMTGTQVGPRFPPPALDADGALDYDSVVSSLEQAMDWLTELYTNTMNIIHFMHDKYNYERVMMALHDSHVRRLLAFGVAGLSVITDSLSAIKYAKVFPIRDENGIAVDFKIEGDFPKFGNDTPVVDEIAQWVVRTFHGKLCKHKTYRGSIPTLSALTITSNVVYGKKTGSTPDGRKKGVAFAPGANPMHGRDCSGAIASLNSVASLPYDSCRDGISNTFTLVPMILGKDGQTRISNLSAMLDGYFQLGGHHINVNVLNRDTLLDAVDHPEKYPNLTIRVSGYAVHFHNLTREQQLEVIARTFHETM